MSEPAQRPRPEANAVIIARIVQWDAKKGFGFLQVGKERVFLHRRDFVEHYKKPEMGDRIRFTFGRDAKGRSCAQNAVHDSRVAGVSVGSLFFLAILLPLPLFGMHRLAFEFEIKGAYLLLLNVLTYWVYASDKKRAKTGAWRTPESHMHLLELLGGWPAAFFAQRKLHHKCSKGTYQTVFWTIVLFHQLLALDYLYEWELSGSALKFAISHLNL